MGIISCAGSILLQVQREGGGGGGVGGEGGRSKDGSLFSWPLLEATQVASDCHDEASQPKN